MNVMSDITSPSPAPEQKPATPLTLIPGYDIPEYLRQREAKLQLIPTNAFLDAVSRNAWMVTTGLMMTATGIIAGNSANLGLALGLLGAAVAVSVIGAVAGYIQDKILKPSDLIYSEVKQVADAKVNAQELATALTQTLGQEIQETKQAAKRNADAIDQLRQNAKAWEDRVHVVADSALSRSVH